MWDMQSWIETSKSQNGERKLDHFQHQVHKEIAQYYKELRDIIFLHCLDEQWETKKYECIDDDDVF